jgi:hypothetical protein
MTARLAAKIYLGALWLVCVYRAVTQSIAHDEALTYELYLKSPFSQIFHYFHSNHHFLNTLLMYLSVSLFGVSVVGSLPALRARRCILRRLIAFAGTWRGYLFPWVLRC